MEVPASVFLVSPRAILQAREPESRPPSSPGFGFLGEINSTSSTSSLSVSSFFLSGLRDCCLFSIRAKWGTLDSPRTLSLTYTGFKRVKIYRGIEPIDGVQQPGLLNSGPSRQNLWMFAGIPPRHINHLQHTYKYSYFRICVCVE